MTKGQEFSDAFMRGDARAEGCAAWIDAALLSAKHEQAVADCRAVETVNPFDSADGAVIADSVEAIRRAYKLATGKELT